MFELGSISRQLCAAACAVMTLSGHKMFAQSAELAQGANDIPVLRVSASLVVVDAVVTDLHTHKPIRGLTPDDFVLKEEGQEQRILHADHGRIPLSIVFMIDLTRTVRAVRQSLGTAAQGILSHLDEKDEIAVAVFSSSAKIVLPFTTDRAAARSALMQASQMSSDEPTFLNEAVYQVTSQLMPSAMVGNRRTIICLTDGTADIPSDPVRLSEAPSMGKIPLHTEQEAGTAVLQAATTVNAVIEKSAMSYFIEASRHPHAEDVRSYPPGNVKAYANLSGGIVLSSSKANGAEAFLNLLDELNSRYTLSYRPSEPAPVKAFRHIDLMVTPEAASRLGPTSVKTRQGYYR